MYVSRCQQSMHPICQTVSLSNKDLSRLSIWCQSLRIPVKCVEAVHINSILIDKNTSVWSCHSCVLSEHTNLALLTVCSVWVIPQYSKHCIKLTTVPRIIHANQADHACRWNSDANQALPLIKLRWQSSFNIDYSPLQDTHSCPRFVADHTSSPEP